MSNIDQNTEEKGGGHVYEAGYHFLTLVPVEDLQKEVASLKDVIASCGGSVISEEFPTRRALAYPMTKSLSNKNTVFNEAYFGWTKFEGSGECAEKIGQYLKTHVGVLRYLVIHTVKDTTAPTTLKKPVAQSVAPTVATEKPAVRVEKKEAVNEEEIDKAIEDLVEAS